MRLKDSSTHRRAIIGLALLALALVVGGGGSLIVYAWDAINHLEAQRETLVVRRGVDNLIDHISNETASNAAWDELYKNTEGPFDLNWLDVNLADYYRLSFAHNVTLIFNAQGQLGYAFRDGHRADPAANAALAQSLGPIIRKVQDEEMRRRKGLEAPRPVAIGNAVSEPVVIRLGQDTYVLGVSTITLSNGMLEGKAMAPVVISGKRVDQRFLKSIENDLGIHDAQLVADTPAVPGIAPLPGSTSAIAWTPETPGMEVLQRISGQITLVAFLLGLTSLALGIRIRRLLLAARAHEQARQATEAAMVKARDLAEAASVAKSQFIANISHEIRTPLNGILGMAQVLEYDHLSPSQSERVKTIMRSGNALLTVLNDVLDISKMEAGKLEIVETDFDLAQVIESVCDCFQDTSMAKGVALDFHIAPEALGHWRGDAIRIRQILLNLISNGLKFTEAGSVHLTVAHIQGALRFEVRDEGIGIPADKLALLFGKFSQIDASTTRRFGGTGLGLAISRELALLMGGDIEVESREGEGSRFSLVLRLDRAAAAPTETDLSATTPTAHPGLRILAAEDNETNRMVLRALIEPMEAELTLVTNGAEAVEAFQAGMFDIVLMDIQMPVMNGLEAAGRIREIELLNNALPTPILALTANALRHQIDEYMAVGMNGHVPKPIQISTLWEAIFATQPSEDALELPQAIAG